MTLAAVNAAGKLVPAGTSMPGAYWCPVCDDRMTLKASSGYTTPHFAHPPDPFGTCSLRTRDPDETVQHVRGKHSLGRALRAEGYDVAVDLHDCSCAHQWTTCPYWD
jgi:competence CoiA-like predicted nuclease